MGDANAKATRDRHPELSAPIVDLSLEARIARAEQAVIDRDARVRGDALRVRDTLRSGRGAAVRWAGIAGAAAAAAGLGYAGYKAWSARRAPPPGGERPDAPSKMAGFAAEIASIGRLAIQWALRLHGERGVSGSLFAMARSALWPKPATAPASSGIGPSNATGGLDVGS